MKYNYNKLRGKIKEVFGTQQELCKQLHCSERTLSYKLSNKLSWKQNEILNVIQLLGLDIEDIPKYFFDYEVQNI